MVKNSLMVGMTVSTLVLLAGCGSSSSKTSTESTANAGATGTTSTAASGSAYGHTPASTATSTAASTGSGVVVTSKHAKIGTVLAAGPKKLTVYLFEGDKGATSACSGACAAAWPPVTTSGATSATGAAKSADLGTIARPDGTKQVTYKGHPLYYFVKDKDGGDAYGQGVSAFGASWYVLTPGGSKIDES